MKTIVIKYEHKKPEDMETPYRLINESLIFDETISPHKVGKRQINTQPIHVPTKNQLSKATKKKGHTNIMTPIKYITLVTSIFNLLPNQ